MRPVVDSAWPQHLALGVLVALAYPLQPLYSGNQNVYLVHALAETVMPALLTDGVYLQPDPFPFFTVVSKWLLNFSPWALHLGYVLLTGVYVHALFRIVQQVVPEVFAQGRSLVFAAFFLLMHCSEVWGSFLGFLFNLDLRWAFDSGLAEQGLLRGYWQPSVFGVFLLLGMAYAFEVKPGASLVCYALAGAFHANYLLLALPLAMYTLLMAINHGLWRQLGWGFVVASIVVAYPMYWSWVKFLPKSADEALSVANAVAVLGKQHPHFDPSGWLNGKSIVQFALVFGAYFAYRSYQKLRLVFISMAGFGVASLVALAMPGSVLYSFTPWRFSVVVVPVCMALLVAKGVVKRPKWAEAVVLMGLVTIVGFATFRLFGGSATALTWKVGLGLFVPLSGMVAFAVFNQKPQIVQVLALIMMLSAGVGGAIAYKVETTARQSSGQYKVAENARLLPYAGTVLIPPHFTHFRLMAQRPVLIDANLHHTLQLPDRLALLKQVEGQYAQGIELDQVIAKWPEVFLVVVPKKKMPTDLTGWHRVNEVGEWALLARTP